MAPLSAAPALTQHPSPRSSNISFAIIEISRKWWNWQTHHLEGVAPKGVGVQVPPSAPTVLVRKSRPEGFPSLMIVLITILHVFVCLFLIIVVLLQSAQSGDIAAAFGGQGSQTAFGPRGAATALSKATTWSAVIFMLTSISLSVLSARKGGPGSVFQGSKPAQTAPQPPMTPAQQPQQK